SQPRPRSYRSPSTMRTRPSTRSSRRTCTRNRWPCPRMPSGISSPRSTATSSPRSRPTTRSRTSDVLAHRAAGPVGSIPAGPAALRRLIFGPAATTAQDLEAAVAQSELHDPLHTGPDERAGLPRAPLSLPCMHALSSIRGGDARRGDRVPLPRPGERLPARGGVRERGARAPRASALVPGSHGRGRGDGRGRGAGAPHRHLELSGCRSSPERLGPRIPLRYQRPHFPKVASERVTQLLDHLGQRRSQVMLFADVLLEVVQLAVLVLEEPDQLVPALPHRGGGPTSLVGVVRIVPEDRPA